MKRDLHPTLPVPNGGCCCGLKSINRPLIDSQDESNLCQGSRFCSVAPHFRPTIRTNLCSKNRCHLQHCNLCDPSHFGYISGSGLSSSCCAFNLPPSPYADGKREGKDIELCVFAIPSVLCITRCKSIGKDASLKTFITTHSRVANGAVSWSAEKGDEEDTRAINTIILLLLQAVQPVCGCVSCVLCWCCKRRASSGLGRDIK